MDPPDTPAGGDEPTPSGERLAGRRVLQVTLLLILAIPTSVWLTRPSPSEDPPVPGGVELDEAAPDFTLELFDGARFALSNHLDADGRSVVMNFWASWCLPCREEMPAFDTVAHRHPEVLFIGVAVQDTEAAARDFAAEVGVSYPLGFDSDGAIAELYPILGLPTTWFITSDGMIAARWSGQLHEDSLESLIEDNLTG